MFKKLSVYIVVLTGLLFVSCQKEKILLIKNIKINVEIAGTAQERQKGLMFRTQLPENKGMLFIFPENEILSFWMRNTFIPLSIAFIDENGYIIQIEDMSPLDETTLHTSRKKARYALEMNQGWFRKNNIMAGDRIDKIK